MVTAGNPGIVYTDSSGAVYYNYYDGKIYCMDLDGSNQRLVFDDSKYDITGIRGVAGGKIVCNINQKYVDSLNQYGYGLIGGFLLISNNGTSEVIQYDNREFKVCK
jgi:hypothetical protein